jgi:hypothetical protein
MKTITWIKQYEQIKPITFMPKGLIVEHIKSAIKVR